MKPTKEQLEQLDAMFYCLPYSPTGEFSTYSEGEAFFFMDGELYWSDFEKFIRGVIQIVPEILNDAPTE